MNGITNATPAASFNSFLLFILLSHANLKDFALAKQCHLEKMIILNKHASDKSPLRLT